jgi:hypothetical protein
VGSRGWLALFDPPAKLKGEFGPDHAKTLELKDFSPRQVCFQS